MCYKAPRHYSHCQLFVINSILYIFFYVQQRLFPADMRVIRCWSLLMFFLALVGKQSFKVSGGEWTMDRYIQTIRVLQSFMC